ncbi:tRNA-specific adenosine-34 deaminase [hydrothermal vent metagenome]|uniref:tRNA-specific adenosine deaminase 2 n=1 Tax=hydrothermal vent metagenome TaxID=652676 RepID=A0A3B0VN49_9ZZZZ
MANIIAYQASSDEFWMAQAIEIAKKAEDINEVPVGAIIVKDEQIVGSGFNQVISKHDASAHAEIQALRNTSKNINNYRIINATLYVTLEPCMMCVGAMVHARIARLVFGAFDPKTGMVTTRDKCFDKSYHNHKITYLGGVLELDCARLLQKFFKQKRIKKN